MGKHDAPEFDPAAVSLFREDGRGSPYPFMRQQMVESLDTFDIAEEMLTYPGTRVIARQGTRRAGRADSMQARFDAALTAAFARQFEYVFKELYETEYPEHRAMEFIPVSTEVPPGSLMHTYRMINKIGNAKIISSSGMAQDFPNADIEGEETPLPVVTLGSSYNWTVLDMQRAAMSQQGNLPIEALKADSARYAIEYLLEQLAAVGSANDGLPGLTNLPGVNATTQVSTGTWATQVAAIGSANVSNNTVPALVVAQAIGADVAAAVSKIRTQSKLVYRPDTWLSPTTALIAIEENVRSPGFTEDTIKQWLEKVYELDIEGWPFLDLANGGTSGMAMCYKRDPKILQMILAQPFTQLAPQPRSAAWQVPCMAQYGGIVARYPLAITSMTGIA